MEKWLAKMEYKWGKYCPRNLMLIIVGGQIAVWLVVMLAYEPLYYLIQLDRGAILSGQVWRLVTFLFSPVQMTMNPLFFALALYLIYMIGSSLERAWGNFKFTFYVLLGVAGAWLACFIAGSSGATALYFSLFFAFAYLYPDMELLLFFVLPVKVKWLGWAGAALYAWQLVGGILPMGMWIRAARLLGVPAITWPDRLALLVGLLGFLVFFGRGAVHKLKTDYVNRKRRKEWQNQWRNR